MNGVERVDYAYSLKHNVSMNRLSRQQRTQVIAQLVEGSSIRSTVRITGVAKNTVTKLLVGAGIAAAAFHDDNVRNLSAQRIQMDEIWAFCYSKQKNVPEDHKGEFGYGDIWTWVAIDADTKLVASFTLGARNSGVAWAFVADLAQRITGRAQITSDGNTMYLNAMDNAFAGQVDYAMLVKKYGDPGTEGARRYSPAEYTGADKRVISGNPDDGHISTSYVERQNLTMRMGMRRFTRLTNGFSKKVENMACAVSLHFLYYNFVRSHQSLKGQTPAMAAGLADRKWTIDDIVGLIEADEARENSQKPN